MLAILGAKAFFKSLVYGKEREERLMETGEAEKRNLFPSSATGIRKRKHLVSSSIPNDEWAFQPTAFMSWEPALHH